MMNIGDPVPQTRVPALVQGQLQSFTLSHKKGTRMAICCTSSIAELEVLVVNSQIHRFEEYETTLLSLLSADFPFSSTWRFEPKTLRIPMLADPLKRLTRRLGLSRSISFPRCESLLFDGDGRLEFRLIHDLNVRGLTMLLEILAMKQQQDWQSTRPDISPALCSTAHLP